jgi:undecaprenyl-diphosphatase
MTFLEAMVLAIVEGLTEFLPVSSTGHMVLTSSVMGTASSEFVKMFTVAIQFGAILSVLVLYWKRFFQSISFYIKLGIAFIPAAVIGFLFNDYIDMVLENPIVVAIALLLGGIVLLFVDKWFAANEQQGTTEVTPKNAFMVGLFQVIAMIPGVSRSAATIIGGLSQKLTRTAAAEFSFFLAVPTMFAATAYKMLKYHKNVGFTSADFGVLAVGNIVAFIVAIIAIKGFIGFLTKHGFKVFGWYRIVVGAAILLLYALGYELQMI